MATVDAMFSKGDRVYCGGRPATVLGPASRASCARVSVSVRYDDGRVEDQRIAAIVRAPRETPSRTPSEASESSHLEKALRSQLASVDAFHDTVSARVQRMSARQVPSEAEGDGGAELKATLDSQLESLDAYRHHVYARLDDVSAGREARRRARHLEAEARQQRRQAAASQSRICHELVQVEDDTKAIGKANMPFHGASTRPESSGQNLRSVASHSSKDDSAAITNGHAPLYAADSVSSIRDRNLSNSQSDRRLANEQLCVRTEDENAWGLGHRMLPDRYVEHPVGGEIKAGYGIGNRILNDEHADKPLGGEVQEDWGIGNRSISDRWAHRRLVGGEIEADYGIGNRILANNHAEEPLGGEIEEGWGIGNRVINDRYVEEPLGGEVEAAWGIGNRSLADSHTIGPLGGEIETGWGIGSRVIANKETHHFKSEPLSRVDQAEQFLRTKLQASYAELRSAFRALDRSDNGFISHNDFLEAMQRVFLPSGFPRQDLLELARRFDLNGDGFVSYNEFVAYIERRNCDKVALSEPKRNSDNRIEDVDLIIQSLKTTVDRRFTSLKTAFMAFSTERHGFLTLVEFQKALNMLDITDVPEKAEAAFQRFDESCTGRITYADFCRVMAHRFQFGTHLDRQMFRDKGPPRADSRASSPRGATTVQEPSTQSISEALLDSLLREKMAVIAQAFHAIDRKGCSVVLRSDLKLCLNRRLKECGLEPAEINAIFCRLKLDDPGMISYNELLGVVPISVDNIARRCHHKTIEQAEAEYGIGTRMLDNRHTNGPFGGELKAGWGINNRVLEDCTAPKPHVSVTTQSLEDRAEQIVRDKLQANYSSVRAAFRAVDRSNNGYISGNDFLQATQRILLPCGFTHNDIERLMERFDLNKDGCVSYEEFAAYLEGSRQLRISAAKGPTHLQHNKIGNVDLALQHLKESLYQRYESTRDGFLAIADHKTSLTRDNFNRALQAHDIELSLENQQALWERFDIKSAGRIDYSQFCKIISQRPEYGMHLERQMFVDGK